MGKVWMLMINLQTGGPACNLTGDITVLQNQTSCEQRVLCYVTGQLVVALTLLIRTVWNRRNPPAADPFESFLPPGLTHSDHQSTQRLLYGPEGHSASRRAISYRRGADELALTRVRSSARSPPTIKAPPPVPARHTQLRHRPLQPPVQRALLSGSAIWNAKRGATARKRLASDQKLLWRISAWVAVRLFVWVFFWGGATWTWEQADA